MTPGDLAALAPRLVDLSLPIREGMFPVAEGSDVRVDVLQRYDSAMGMRETRLRTSCHAGTHMDYPSHIDPSGPRAFTDDPRQDALFPGATLTTAYLMAFDGKAGTAPQEGPHRFGDLIEAEEIDAWFEAFDAAHPGFDHGAVQGAVLRTGWNERWFEPDFFRRGSPTLSDAATRRLVDRGLRYLGSDFLLSAHPGGTHDIVLRGSHRWHVEGLVNLGALRGRLIGLLLAPLKIVGAEGLPARVYGLDLEVG